MLAVMASIAAPKAVQALDDRFDRDRAVFRSGEYKEEQLRLEFLNPLFEALGWGVCNKQRLSGTCKPVVHRESHQSLLGEAEGSRVLAVRRAGLTAVGVEAILMLQT